MNIICCSLPAIWGNELLLGVDGPCPAVISRANTIAPEVCAAVPSTVRTEGVFLWTRVFQQPRAGCAFVFPLKGVSRGSKRFTEESES